MAKVLVIGLAAVAVLAVQGCSSGTITSKQQEDKANAVHKWVEAHATGPHDRGSQ